MKFVATDPNFKLPKYQTPGASAFDVAAISTTIVIPGMPNLVDLGFKAAVPVGYVALILPRSGLGHKKGTRLRNTIGVIDSDYRGNWMASMILDDAANPGKDQSLDPIRREVFQVGDRIAQVLVLPVVQAELVLAQELDDTERGEGGYGSTGK